ncbi:unnamed protein product [Brassica rapa subsp. trilocularis]
MEDLFFSTSERFLPASLRGFVGVLSEHLLHDGYLPHPVNSGEMQSFLKPPWPGDYKIASSVHEQTSLLMGLFGDSKLSKMVYEGYKVTDVNLSP